MGVVTSRLSFPFFKSKSPDAYKKELENINKEVLELEKSRTKLRRHYTLIIDVITTYSRLLYVLVGLVFFFTTLPSTFLEYIFFCGPLIILYLLVYVLKIALKWYYNYENARKTDRVKKLKFKKKQLLCQVKETTQFKEAKEILETYGPDKKIPFKEFMDLQGPKTRKDQECLDSLVSYVLGEQRSNSLICNFCKYNNGMAMEEEHDYMGYRCCHCGLLNLPRKVKFAAKKES